MTMASSFILLQLAVCCAGIANVDALLRGDTLNAVKENNDVTLDVDWSAFLSRHDMLWHWDWDAGGIYTLQPISTSLNFCGPNGSIGECCITSVAGSSVALQNCNATDPTQHWVLQQNGTVMNQGNLQCLTSNHQLDSKHSLQESFAGSFQIGLTNRASWTCSPTAVPPGQCCLPVAGGLISGCHDRHDARWKYNQFYMLPNVTNSLSFKLATMYDNTECAAVKDGKFTSTTCSSEDQTQEWTVIVGQNTSGAMIQNVGTKQCLSAVPKEAGTVYVGVCEPTSNNTWEPICDAVSYEVLPNWRCNSDNGLAVMTAPCDQSIPWAEFEGFWMANVTAGKSSGLHDGPGATPKCLQINVPSSFCDGSICPSKFSSNFTSGQSILNADCTDGDRSQLIAAYTIPTQKMAARQNLIPLTWAVSAYTGNGLIGVRIQSEEGGVGVLHVLIDNVEMGAGGKRQPNGYFRFHVADESSGSVSVSLKTHLATSVLEGNVTSIATGEVVTTFSIFVNSNLSLPVVILNAMSKTRGLPALEWIDASNGAADFAWANRSGDDGLTVWASVINGKVNNVDEDDASTVVSTASKISPNVLLQQTSAWWSTYWSQSFVSIPLTRLEGFYYVQMFRFPSSDRVTLQGLMGAYGPTGNFNLWPDDVWDMNEQVMYWIGSASNRMEITNTLTDWFEAGHSNGGLWMIHNYVKTARFLGNDTKTKNYAWPAIVENVQQSAGSKQSSPGKLQLLDPDDGKYHIVGCSSPEYKCYPPFEDRACSPHQDCNYELSQLRWGLQTALDLATTYPDLATDLQKRGVDVSWWHDLMDGNKLAWYPYDNVTGFRLDVNCAFNCPHRHFSHLLQIFDLETVVYDPSSTGNQSVNKIIHNGLDNWYRVTCNASNWFNEECRGFTRCGLASMSAVTDRPAAAIGNLTGLVDDVATPNGMYGELVYQAHPNEFSPVSESAYCGAGVLHTMYLHTNPKNGILSVFPGLGSSWKNASFHLLRASGALLVSASRVGGATQFVRLASGITRNVTISVPADPLWNSTISPKTLPSTTSVTSTGLGQWTMTIKANSSVVLYAAGSPPFTIRPVPSNSSEYNWFGYTRQIQPLH